MIASCLSRAAIPSNAETKMLSVSLREHNLRGIAVPCLSQGDGDRMRNRREVQMSVELNHTVIPAKDQWVSAKFLADILDLEAGPEWGHFVPVKITNGVTLDFDTREEFPPGPSRRT